MPGSSAPSTPPEILANRYLIGKEVGTGSSGAVYLARDRESGDKVAVKVREAKTSDQPVRFIAEAHDMMRLRHPRLVHVLDTGQEGNLYWYVMPYYAGGSLRDVVKQRGPVSAAQSLDWSFQVLEGLSAVHSADLVHRDVKPHNVMLDEYHEVKLTDFGLVRHVAGGVPYRTRTDQSMGTPNYRAPEQAVDAANVDQRADIYGVGATLYFLLAAKRPGFLYMVDEDDPAMAAVPETLRGFVLKCMAYEPGERFADVRSAAAEIATLYDQLPERADDAPVAAAWLKRFDQMGTGGIMGWLRRWWPG